MPNVETVHIQLEEISCTLLPCPFCGSNNLELANTWTPSYWVECLDCEATKPGQAAKWDTNDQAYEKQRHLESANSAVDAWNTRVATPKG